MREVVLLCVLCATGAEMSKGSRAAQARPASLAGSNQDGTVRARAARLVVDEELRRFFDHHLAGAGEEDEAAARGRIDAILDATLAPSAAAEGHELLDRYLDLRRAGLRLDVNGDLEARWAAVRALRRDILGDEAARAMFLSEDAELDAALARRPGLPALTAADAETVAPLVALQAEVALPPSEVQALRERTFGAEGAARLAALDEARAAWQARLADYQARRAANATDAPRLLETLFSPEERLRVQALERIATGTP